MKGHILLIFIFYFSLSDSFAQENHFVMFRPPRTHGEGYVITNSGDSLIGKIRLSGSGKIRCISLEDSLTYKKTELCSDNVLRFKMDNTLFRSITINYERFYYEKLINGPCSLYRGYYFTRGGFRNLSFTQVNNPSERLPVKHVSAKFDHFFVLSTEDQWVLVPKSGFKKHMAMYFQKDSALYQEINKKKLGYYHLAKIVNTYNLTLKNMNKK